MCKFASCYLSLKYFLLNFSESSVFGISAVIRLLCDFSFRVKNSNTLPICGTKVKNVNFAHGGHELKHKFDFMFAFFVLQVSVKGQT